MGFGQRLDALREQLAKAPDIDSAAHIASTSYPALGLDRGHRPWRRAVAEVVRLMAVSGGTGAVDAVCRQVESMRTESFTEIDAGDRSPVQLMNLHQTKGREADVIVAVFRSGDFHGHEQEPFASASRLLYVVLTRARHDVTLILPSAPHPLVAPFAQM